MKTWLRWPLMAALVVSAAPLACPVETWGQQPSTGAAPGDDDDFINVADSSVGYVDSAIPATQFRLRFDATYNNTRPTRAEFFWPAGAGVGGPPGVSETGVNYQDIGATLEYAPTRNSSAFVDIPVRFIDPDLSTNTAGLADISLGFKQALVYTSDTLITFQFRTYAPSADANRGLGTQHVSLEPSLLAFQRLDERLRMETEFRYWIPVGGSAFAGDVIRYGIGLSRAPDPDDDSLVRMSPVVEFVGWTVLDGLVANPFAGVVESAAGDTIVNVKLGVRIFVGDLSQFYVGYGHGLTGDRWYDDVVRLEFRRFF